MVSANFWICTEGTCNEGFNYLGNSRGPADIGPGYGNTNNGDFGAPTAMGSAYENTNYRGFGTPSAMGLGYGNTNNGGSKYIGYNANATDNIMRSGFGKIYFCKNATCNGTFIDIANNLSDTCGGICL